MGTGQPSGATAGLLSSEDRTAIESLFERVLRYTLDGAQTPDGPVDAATEDEARAIVDATGAMSVAALQKAGRVVEVLDEIVQSEAKVRVAKILHDALHPHHRHDS